jgi:hypothetical protein
VNREIDLSSLSLSFGAIVAKAARPFSGTGKWLTAFDLDKLTAGASACFDRIGSETIQRVNAEFATRRKQFKKAKLRWRVSTGAKKDIAATSDGDKLAAGHFYRNIEQKIATAQRRGHKRQAKRLHRTAARRRKDALHKFSRRNCSTRASRPAGALSSLVRETQREHAATARPSPVLQAWTCSL